ncbi:hypothetical protein ACFU3J_15915 [Streptomyces sp. NPDC057411]|uniref:hypothetical protein n=1 Tax=unclassified Streptomyces TaxID=2593676 RepID=UPI0036268307
MPALVTVAVLFLIVFGVAGYTVFHLKPTPVRIAAVLFALGALVAAMVPIVRILAESPQPAPQPVTPPAAAVPQLVGDALAGHPAGKGV